MHLKLFPCSFRSPPHFKCDGISPTYFTHTQTHTKRLPSYIFMSYDDKIKLFDYNIFEWVVFWIVTHRKRDACLLKLDLKNCWQVHVFYFTSHVMCLMCVLCTKGKTVRKMMKVISKNFWINWQAIQLNHHHVV